MKTSVSEYKVSIIPMKKSVSEYKVSIIPMKTSVSEYYSLNLNEIKKS